MRKLFTFLLALVAGIGLCWAQTTTVTWYSLDFTELGTIATNDGIQLSDPDAFFVHEREWGYERVIDLRAHDDLAAAFSTTNSDLVFTKIEVSGGWHDDEEPYFEGEGWSDSEDGRVWTGQAATVPFNLWMLTDDTGTSPWTIVFTLAPAGPAKYTLRLLADPEKGSIALQNPSSDIVLNYDGTYTVPENAEVTILATPLEGYEFSGWRVGSIYEMCYYDYCGGDALSTNDNPLTVTMTADVAYVADFAAATPTPEPEPQPAQQVITWSAQICHDVEAYYNMGQIITANNSKDGITVTYSGSDVNDLDGMRIGGIFLTGGTNSKMTFTSTVGNISKIEVYYYTNVLEDVPVGWTHEVSYDKFVWEGTPAASVEMMKGADRVGFYIRNIDFTIGEAEPEPEPQPQQGIVCTAEDLDKVLCSDGSIYENVAAATAAGKTAVAMIASINTTTNKVVALALEDETGTMDWETAQSTCAAKTAVAGVAWTALSLDQIFGILVAHNGGEDGNYADLNTTIANVGGTSIPTQIGYWTKDEFNLLGICFHFDTEGMIAAGFVERENTLSVRACLEFDLTVSEPQPADVEITPNVDPENPAVYYSTFYDSEVKYLLPENVEAYVATLNGANLLLSKIADAGQTIPADNAVILKSTVTPFTLSISDAEAVPVNAINSLQGTDVSIATPANCYVLAGNDGVGFYHYTASMLNPHKAYVIYSGTPNQAPHRMPFVFNQATDVESIQSSAVSSQKVFRDGQLVIIRNGVEYNAAGQMVK